jgi:hypothetical protein
MKNWIVSKVRQFLNIDSDKSFLLEYGDAISTRIDHLEVRS